MTIGEMGPEVVTPPRTVTVRIVKVVKGEPTPIDESDIEYDLYAEDEA